MSRYIDAEWLLNFFVDIPNNFTLTIGNLRATVNDAPSIDIVRCQDCKFSEVIQNDSSGVMARYCRAFTVPMMRSDDDFCSYGEHLE